MSSQDDLNIVLEQILYALRYNFQKSCEEIISMGFMTLFHFFSTNTHKCHYLKTTNFYIHAADIL